MPTTVPPQIHAEFAVFYKEHLNRLICLLINLGAQRAQAEDLAQDAMGELLLGWPSVKHRRAFVATVARRGLARDRRRSWAELERCRRYALGHDRQHATTLVFDTDTQHVVDALNKLAPRQREVMALRVDGFTPTEIAELTGQPRATVNSHLRHARQKLYTQVIESRTMAGRREGSDGPGEGR